MRWKPIKKLTDADLEKGWMHHRLMLWNSCNGPFHYRYVPAETADDIKREGVWEKFLILPEALELGTPS